MGTLFWLLNGQEEHIEYMKELNLLPDDFEFGRLPTYGELKQILSRLPQYKVEYADHDIYLSQNGQEVAALRVPLDHPRDDSGLIDFYWKYTSEGLMPLIQAIANICGAMVIFNDSNPEGLVFVYPNTSPENNPTHE